MSTTKKITRYRISRRDYYRAQLNVPKDWGFLYNPMCDFLSDEAMDVIRNRMSAAVMSELRHQFKIILLTHPGFRQFLMGEFLYGKVEDELAGEAVSVWEEAGF